MKSINYVEINIIINELLEDSIKEPLIESLIKEGLFTENTKQVHIVKKFIKNLYSKNIYGKEALTAVLLIEYLEPEPLLNWFREEVNIAEFPYTTEDDVHNAREQLDLNYAEYIN